MFYANRYDREIDRYIASAANAVNAEKDSLLGLDPPSMELRVSSKYEDAIAQFFQNAFERYVADYIECRNAPARDTGIEYKIKTLREKKLFPLVEQKTKETDRLSSLGGIFNATKRNECKSLIERIDGRISDLLGEINALEAEAAEKERLRLREIEEFRKLTDEEVREEAREAAIKTFKLSLSMSMYLLEEERKKRKEAQNAHAPTAAYSYGTEQAAPVSTSAPSPTYIPDPPREGIFTGNQLEDYGKIREKILSGDLSSSELREFEIKWGYKP